MNVHYLKMYSLTLFLFITSCSQDKDSPGLSNSDLTGIWVLNDYAQKVTFVELQNDVTFQKLSGHFIAGTKTTATNSVHRLSANKDDGFEIVKDYVSKIKKENYVSYTLNIQRKNNKANVLENLILEEKEGVERAFILKYEFNDSSLLNITNKNNGEVRAKVWIENLTNSSFERPSISAAQSGTQVCRWQTISIAYYCHCKGHAPWEACQCDPPSGWRQQTVQVCEDNPDGTELLFTQVDDGGGLGGGGSNSGLGGSSDGETAMMVENTNELALRSILLSDPFFLLEVDCNQIQKWLELAQFDAPETIQNKIENLQQNHDGPFGDWEIQQLADANGTIVNLDYFSVNISQFPINPDSGQPFTPQGFVDYFRRNINDFTEPLTTFEPYCEISAICQQETNLWNSNNPLGAIVKLDISFNDGVVVLADYNFNFWRFMTLEAPFDCNHPVSGTRQFGIEQMPDGSYNIYVRGVDRFNSNLQENSAYMLSFFAGDSENPFFAADNLWRNFQEKANQFVNNNGGASSIVLPTINRPDWGEVQDVLQGNKPISDLGCN